MAESVAMPADAACPACGARLASVLKSCPSCHRLLHADELKRLASAAESHSAQGQLSEALSLWRNALELLPADSRQWQQVTERINALSARVDAGEGHAVPQTPQAPSHSSWKGVAAGVTGAALLLWKFKAVVAVVLSKGKLLLLGFTKLPTLFSMLLSFGVYVQVMGWKFAAGLILSIYIHEMGHVWELRRFGIKATAPAFIPGFGALIRVKQYPSNPVEDARVGLAGPIWGTAAALAAYAAFVLSDLPIWGAIARVGAYINLFNLVPVWQLDGSHGMRALARPQRWLLLGVVVAACLFTQDFLHVVLAVFVALRAWGGDAPERSDRVTLLQFTSLVVLLTALMSIAVPLGGR